MLVEGKTSPVRYNPLPVALTHLSKVAVVV